MSSINLNEPKPSKFLGQHSSHLLSKHDSKSEQAPQWHSISESEVQQIKTSLEQMRMRNLELEYALKFELTLRHISDKVRDSLEQSQILQNTVRELAIALNLQSCNIVLCDSGSNPSTPPSFCSSTEHSLTPEQQKYIQETSSDIRDQFQESPSHYIVCQFHQLSACDNSLSIACPIFDVQVEPKEISGILWLVRDDVSHFNEMEFLLIQQVATQCAIALRQARCYAESQANARDNQLLNQLKDDFLGTISHELRNPLANIKMAIAMLDTVADPTHTLFETIAEAPGQGTPIQYIDVLEEESDRALKLVEDLLHLQHLEAGTEPQQLSSVNLRDWLSHLIEPFESRTQKQEQSLCVHLAHDLPFLTFDHFSLSRIVTELLTNACKYTYPGGTISIHAKLIGSEAPDGCTTMLQLSVANTGIEIPSDELPRVFDKFYRIPSLDRWKHGGTGLGLALVKKLVEQLHGSIHVVSANNQTQFLVHLPIEV